jgi:signal transduction histidine kinase
MEAGTSPYRFQQLDAATLVQSVVEQFQSEIAGRGYHVALDADGSSATVAADAEALSTAIWNLLDNAVKYSPEARTVWVTVGREGALVMIRVRDAGLGIPHAEQHDIFKKFFRGATARAENISGTGIGLAMVEYIVTAHRGRVAVQSQPGAGSTFTIQLPIEELCPES